MTAYVGRGVLALGCLLPAITGGCVSHHYDSCERPQRVVEVYPVRGHLRDACYEDRGYRYHDAHAWRGPERGWDGGRR